MTVTYKVTYILDMTWNKSHAEPRVEDGYTTIVVERYVDFDRMLAIELQRIDHYDRSIDWWVELFKLVPGENDAFIEGVQFDSQFDSEIKARDHLKEWMF